MDVTLFELHLPDAEFNAPYSRHSDAEAPAGATTAGGGGSSRLGPVAAIIGLVGIALLARYLRGGGAEQATLDEVEA